MKNNNTIRTLSELRAEFWATHPHLEHRGPSVRQNQYPTDTRWRWVDFVDACARSGQITEKLAFRATL